MHHPVRRRGNVDPARLVHLLEAQRAAFVASSDGTSPLTNRPLHAALSTVLDLAIAVTRAQSGSVQLCDADGALRLVATRGFTAEAAQFFRIVKDDKSACHAALKRARVMVVPDVSVSPLYTEPSRRVMLRSRLHACQSTPIRGHDGRVLGMLSTHFPLPHRPTPQQLRRMRVLARHAAILIEYRPPRVGTSDPTAIIDEYRSRHPQKAHTVAPVRSRSA